VILYFVIVYLNGEIGKEKKMKKENRVKNNFWILKKL